MTNIIVRASALGAAALISLLAFLPACHPVGACENCNPAKEYCEQISQGARCSFAATCQPIPEECLQNPTCACVVVPYQCSNSASNCSVQCSGNAKNGFFVEEDVTDSNRSC